MAEERPGLGAGLFNSDTGTLVIRWVCADLHWLGRLCLFAQLGGRKTYDDNKDDNDNNNDANDYYHHCNTTPPLSPRGYHDDQVLLNVADPTPTASAPRQYTSYKWPSENGAAGLCIDTPHCLQGHPSFLHDVVPYHTQYCPSSPPLQGVTQHRTFLVLYSPLDFAHLAPNGVAPQGATLSP